MPETTILCRECGAAMEAAETVTPPRGRGPTIQMFQCPAEECARRAAVIYEPAGGLSEDDRSFVEREVARRGAFFPGEYTGGGGRFGS